MVLLALLYLPAAVAAQPMTRAEVAAEAVKVNPLVLSSTEDLRILEGFVLEARADAFPEINLNASANRYQDPSFLNSPNLDQLPPEFTAFLKPQATALYDWSGTVKQTLYSFKLGAAVRAARLARTRGQEDLQRARQFIALEAVVAYNAVLAAAESLRVANDTTGYREQQLQIVRTRRAGGVATELDVLRSEVSLENARAGVVRAQGVLELARANVNAVMLRPIDTPFEPAETLAFATFETPLDEVIKAALADRPEVKSVALTERINDEFITIAKANKKPSFDFNGGYGWSVREPENFTDSRYSKWTFGAFVRWPVFDGFRTDGKVMQAQAQRSKATQERLAIENRIRIEAKDAYERLTTAARVLAASDVNVSQARKAVELTQANFKFGAATLVDVADAQTALLVAELTRTEALLTHANARATLRYVMGRDPVGAP